MVVLRIAEGSIMFPLFISVAIFLSFIGCMYGFWVVHIFCEVLL